jgi:pimeloyl-ACP methyl ester carboxylesterase
MPGRRLSRRRFLRLAASAIVGASGTPGTEPSAAADAVPRLLERKHFVLIHGAWHGAWCWYKIVAGLEAMGQQVTALDLPAAGIDGTPVSSVTLAAQADRVVTFLDGLSEPVVIVGHSAGGPVISTAAEARPQKIERLVYLTAFLLPDGGTLLSVAAQDSASQLTRHLAIDPAHGTIDVDPAGRVEAFYGDCSDQDVALAQSLFKPVALGSLADPVHIGGNFAGVRRFYITCLRDRAISPSVQRSMYTALPCEKVLPIASSHSPFLSHPAQLLRALAKIARA